MVGVPALQKLILLTVKANPAFLQLQHVRNVLRLTAACQ